MKLYSGNCLVVRPSWLEKHPEGLDAEMLSSSYTDKEVNEIFYLHRPNKGGHRHNYKTNHAMKPTLRRKFKKLIHWSQKNWRHL